MKSNCEAVRGLFSRYLRDELTAESREVVEAHTVECETCRAAMGFERALDSGLATPIVAPDSLFANARARVVVGAEPAKAGSWSERIFGRTLMRKLLVSGTAVAALCVIVFALLPSAAGAASARDTFRQMKAAMKTSKKQMQVSVEATVTSGGQVQATVKPNGTTGPTPMAVTSTVKREGNQFVLTAHVSFDEADYSKIAFGKNHDTLVLNPKKQPSMKYEVAIDHKSKLPLSWTAFAKNAGAWKKLGAYRFSFLPAKSG